MTSMPLLPATPHHGDQIPLSTDLPGSGGAERWHRLLGQTIVRNVSHATLEPFLPEPDKATGAAVIVAPGGGFKFLSMDNEGWPIARWLAERGIAAFVLKYRLNETPEEDVGFGAVLQAMLAAAHSRNTEMPALTEPRATADAMAAVRLVRANAVRWGVDPARVGILGFSAGAITALDAVVAGGGDARPSFLGYVYGPMVTVPVPIEAPPMFTALALDDPLFGHQGFGLVDAWRRAGAPVELHAYERGGHGYGMGTEGTTTTGTMDQFVAWMQARGLLARR